MRFRATKPYANWDPTVKAVLQELHDRELVEPVRAGVWRARETACKVTLKAKE